MKHLKGSKNFFWIVLDTKRPYLVLLKDYLFLMKGCDTGFCLMGDLNVN